MIVFEGIDRSLREGVVFKFVSSLSELNAVIARRDGRRKSRPVHRRYRARRMSYSPGKVNVRYPTFLDFTWDEG